MNTLQFLRDAEDMALHNKYCYENNPRYGTDSAEFKEAKETLDTVRHIKNYIDGEVLVLADVPMSELVELKAEMLLEVAEFIKGAGPLPDDEPFGDFWSDTFVDFTHKYNHLEITFEIILKDNNYDIVIWDI